MKIEILQSFLIVALVLGIGGYFLYAGRSIPGPRTLSSGLVVEDVIVGEGSEAASGNRLFVHYVGQIAGGGVFDVSRNRGDVPFDFVLEKGEVITGWDEGLAGMKVGGKRKIIIPPALGYGDRQVGIIPPGSTLLFEVDLIDMK